MCHSGFIGASLFWEPSITRPVDKRVCIPIFSLYNDRPGMVNCQKTFVGLGDPTGYKWAMKYLGSWEHFLRLTENQWFSEALAKWRQELETKQLAEDLEVIRNISRSDAKDKLTAAKYLANREWEKPKRGRPTKKEVAGALKEEMRRATGEQDDYDRIKDRLKVVK